MCINFFRDMPLKGFKSSGWYLEFIGHSTHGCFRFCENVIRILIRNSYTLVPFPTNRYWYHVNRLTILPWFFPLSRTFLGPIGSMARWFSGSEKERGTWNIWYVKWAPKLVTKCFWSSNIFQMPKTAHIPRFYSRWKYVCSEIAMPP